MTLGDIETSRAKNGGIPTDVAPGKRCSQWNAHDDWAAAYIMLPWYLYLYYGDSESFKTHWKGLKTLMTHYQASSDGWILSRGYGDFFDPGTEAIVMHTPIPLTCSLWFFRCADIMARMARVLEDYEAEQRYNEWRGHIARAIKDRFFDSVTGSFGSQCGNVLALAFKILPDEDQAVLAALVKDIRDRDIHMNVGVMGVRFILEELTQNGYGELALALMRQNTYPSFGHLIERGATTLWECWGEEGHNKTHGARSLNHPFMGGYDNWFFNTLAGIRPDPAVPGFNHFFLKPHPVPGLSWIRCHYNCPQGRIESNWRLENGKFIWDIAVPEGTSATVTRPYCRERLRLKPGHYQFSETIDK
ncbi:MAG: alpha-L-rhamnosidase C-terminal domain-containing protein [Lentisphaeria bacterium]|nr:alpha-L-rhamnosidase C-terminal domain-containing protein [Lentisphaeria bacterium]